MRRSILLFLSLLVVVSVSNGWRCFADEDEFGKLLRAGGAEADHGNYFAAVADIEAAVRLAPNRPEGWYQLGLLRGQMADFQGAETAFRRALQLKTDFAKAHFNLGLTLIANPKNKLDWPGAIIEFHDALKYQPDYAEAHNLLGAGLAATGDAGGAIPELERALQLMPSLASAHFNLALSLENTGRFEEAVSEYRRAIAAKGSYAEASTGLGKLLLRLGKMAESEQELEKVLCDDPDLADAHYTLARVLRSLHRNRESAIEFDEAKELGQRDADAAQSSYLSNVGLELASKGDLAGAAASLEKAIALRPEYGVPHYNLGLVFADRGDMAGASQELVKAISLLPGQPKPWLDLGRVFRRQGDYRSALEAVSWAARLSPSDSAIHSELVLLESMKGSGSATIDAVPLLPRPSVGAASDTATAHIAFASELDRRGDFMGEIEELRRALALQPAAMGARRSLAKAYERLGDNGLAMLEYYKMLRLAPRDGALHFELGDLLLKKGDAKDAVEQFQLALTYDPGLEGARVALDEAVGASTAVKVAKP